MSTRESDRITVKIHNMKRSGSRERDSSRSKRRGSFSRYDGSSDEGEPDRVRRRVIRSPSPRTHSPREDYHERGSERPTYKVLCVSALHAKASEEYIKETLYREYKQFGDFSIRISHDLDERVAYVCFRTPEDAREAKHSKPRVVLYGKVALVEPVYESRDSYRARRSASPPGEYDRYHYTRSSPSTDSHSRRRAPTSSEHHYERYPISDPLHPHPRFRPPIHHHEGYLPPPPHGPPYIPRHPHHIHHPPHPYMHHPRPIIPRPHHPGSYEKAENKKDKFPNYLHHVQPEEDPLAARTLFAGNLEINISDEELRRIFGKYGIVEDIDIKRPPPGTGNAFAFVRYQNLDMAHRAKVELSGQYIGKFQCKIGYGKATPTARIWLGGLGAWTSVTQLEREFDRFGAIKKIEYQKGDTCAYILYESVEAATSAVKEMRGFPLGGPDKRLRTDFAEVAGQPTPAPYKKSYDEDGTTTSTTSEYRRPEYDGYHESSYDEIVPYGYPPYHPPARGGYRSRGGYRGRGSYRGMYHNEGHRLPHPPIPREDDWRPPPPPHDRDYHDHRGRSGSREPDSKHRSPRGRRSPDSDSDSSSRRNGVLSSAKTFSDITKKIPVHWQGALILKSSLFPAKLHLTDGDADIVESLMKDENDRHNLRITQRLRLDPPKLDDVQKRMNSSSSHAIFLGLAASTSSVTSEDSGVQTRPLRNLVSYLKQKEAAGVISLLNKETEATGVLYAFPPCEFSTELLKRTCHSVSEEAMKEDHLVIVVVRGGSA